MLDELATFLSDYLVCTDDQLTILALWIVHTWCFDAFSTTAYLDIRSPEPQCGKTRCIELLTLLSADAWHVTGADASIVMDQLISAQRALELNPNNPGMPAAVIVDDCHQTFSLSEQQPLIALLNSGTNAKSSYLCRLRGNRIRNYNFFMPKAFAGNRRLPRSLADRCIPILLHRKKNTDRVSRFNGKQAADAAAPLLAWLKQWTDDNFKALSIAAQDAPAGPALNFTARQQDCGEPLLHIADAIGGHWPEEARTALASVFNTVEVSRPLQLLADIRTAFATKENPTYLSTASLLRLLSQFDLRPWSEWNDRSGKLLGGLLRPFGVASRNLFSGPGVVLKGYRLSDLQEVWDRYLPPLAAEVASAPEPPRGQVYSGAHSGSAAT
jgi:Protein of unknown function (DUF3631)